MAEEYKIKTKKFRTWKSFKEYATSFSENWIFRGQTDANWDLKTSLERSGFSMKYDGIENSFLIDFKRAAENFLDKKDIPTDLIEWLALMQHHGAPTRLLDFSKSIFTAAYFAFEPVDYNSSNIAIWAIDINSVTQSVIEHLRPYYIEDFQKSHGRLTDEIFEDVFYSRQHDCILPAEPFKMNRRYYLQQSVFISVGDSTVPFMEQLGFLERLIDESIIKMILPKKISYEVLTDLNKMNINRASLFPDLDGYAKSLKMKYIIMPTMSERIGEVIKEKKEIHGIDIKANC